VPKRDWTLADVRGFSGWTKAQAAEALGVPRATYDAMEAGRRTFRADLLERLAHVLGCSTSVLKAAHRRGVDPDDAA
jgi:transcriptional regulator with XRE-family HTH domain